jgi:xylulokinase
MAVLAIDLGTTGCKAALFDGREMLSSAYRHYQYVSRQDGWADQDADAVWELISAVVKEALASSAGKPAVQAISVSVQGDAIIPIDSKGNALHPAILGMDTRSHQEAADLEGRFGRGQIYAATGMPCEPLNAITKIFWLKRHCPDLGKRVWKYVHYEEFLLMKLAGIPALDYSMASRTMAFDPAKKQWVPWILEFVGLTPSQLGNVSPSGVPIGIVLKSVAEEWGIDRGALVVAGGHDQCMAAIGSGVIEGDLACYSMGTAEVISTCFATPQMTAAMLQSNYPCYSHAVKDFYFTISLNQSGGISLEWFQQAILQAGLREEAGRQELYEALIAGLQFQPSPVLFLPHLVGSGTPTCDHRSRGAFIGLSLKVGRADLFQAVVDAMAFEARLNLETLDHLKIPIAELRAVGGGARSRKILELKATALNRPIATLKNPQAALLGTAMQAQTAIGIFKDLEEARQECVLIEETIEPRREALEAYNEAFLRFRQLYDTLKSFYHHWRGQ